MDFSIVLISRFWVSAAGDWIPYLLFESLYQCVNIITNSGFIFCS